MAAAQWAGGKCKSIQQAKAFIRHNSVERRKETQHTNPHIDKSKTHLNFSVKGLTYEQRCAAFDKRLGDIDLGRASSGKNARVVMQSVIVYPPAGLVDDKRRLKQWFLRAGELAEARFGANMIDMAVDYDEVHEYIEPKTKTRKMSREHGHLWLVPAVDGKLNGKAFSSRKAMMDFNGELHEMSLSEFGVPMMDGTGKKGGKSVEQCKAASDAAAIKADAETEAQRTLLTARLEVQRVRENAERRIKALEARERRLRQAEGDYIAKREKGLERLEKAVEKQDAYTATVAAWARQRGYGKAAQQMLDGSAACDAHAAKARRAAPPGRSMADIDAAIAGLTRSADDSISHDLY